MNHSLTSWYLAKISKMALAFLVRWLWRQGYLTHPWKGLGVPGTRVFRRQDEQGMATTGKVQLLLLPSLTEARSSGGAGEAAALGSQGDGVARRVALREARQAGP